jgi:FkbM family methyltransferase
MSTLKQRLYEFVRCTRHNLRHLKMFRISFDGTYWHVRDRAGLDLLFPFYPYLTALEMEGYFRQGAWGIEPGMTVIDVGACYGEFALYAARKVGPGGRVLMLEPDEANLRTAQKVFDLNGGMPPQVELLKVGLWHTPGELSFAAGNGPVSTLAELSEATTDKTNIQKIAVESLSSLVEKKNLQRLDFVKMDIEGAEVEVIGAARPVTDTLRPRFSIASYHMREGRKASTLLEPMFKEYGYDVETGFDSHPTTWASPAKQSP